MLRRETINHPRVPVVQDGSRVNEEHHRGAGIVRPELAVSELHSACGDRPRWHIPPIDLQVLRCSHVAALLSAMNVTLVITRLASSHLSETTTLPLARPAST